VIVTQPFPLDVTLDSLVEISCFGQRDARIIVDTSGGTQPLQFFVNGSLMGPSTAFDQLGPGRYEIIVSDANDCRDTLGVVIPDIPGLRMTFDEIRNERCAGEQNGFIRISSVGGSGTGFQLSLDGINFQEEDSISGLAPGTYNVFLMDNTGCVIDSVFTILPGTMPEAMFSATAEPCSFPMLVALENQSTNALDFHWDFGDGEQRQSFQPPFAYVEEGNYEIRLIASDANGCHDTAYQSVSVSRSVLANFAIQPDLPIPRFIEEAYYEFDNRSEHADFYRWDFGDGATSMGSDLNFLKTVFH
jgi:hypothetical protein